MFHDVQMSSRAPTLPLSPHGPQIKLKYGGGEENPGEIRRRGKGKVDLLKVDPPLLLFSFPGDTREGQARDFLGKKWEILQANLRGNFDWREAAMMQPASCIVGST